MVYRLCVKAPRLPQGTADRMETWKRVAKSAVRRQVENYVIETLASGAKQFVPIWEDNWRLACVDGVIYELLSSKPVAYWR